MVHEDKNQETQPLNRIENDRLRSLRRRSTAQASRSPSNRLSHGSRRNTLALAKDMFMRRLSAGAPIAADDVSQLVHEVIHQVASYRQMVQLVGTGQDSTQLRKEMHELQKQCIKQADQTKLAMLPQLKQESHEGAQSTDFTRQAKQFSACLGSFIVEMKRAQRLFGTFPGESTVIPTQPMPGAQEQLNAQPSASTSSGQMLNSDQAELEEDMHLTNSIMETLDELITSPFSTGPTDDNREHVVPKNRSKGCSNFDWVCKSFKTSYA